MFEPSGGADNAPESSGDRSRGNGQRPASDESGRPATTSDTTTDGARTSGEGGYQPSAGDSASGEGTVPSGSTRAGAPTGDTPPQP
jgi:hypothetical protein